jgi:hypothetical protein
MKLRVCVGTTEISGIAAGLAAGFNEIGVSAQVLLSHAHPFGYEQDTQSGWLLKRWQKLGTARNAVPRHSILKKVLVVIAHQLCSWMVLFQALSRYDAFIYLFGDTFTRNPLELGLLRLLGKKIVIVYVGSDVRPPYMAARHSSTGTEEVRAAALSLAVRAVKKRLKWQECQAHYVVNSPATAQLGEVRYIDWFSMGIPRALVFSGAAPVDRNDGRIRILHSPSNPVIKGSAKIVETIEKLTAAGYPIDFVKIEGMPNERVIQELSACDFVVDQLYSDTPMAVFATEAALLGKPAVVAGYFSGVMKNHLAPEDVPPSLYVHPEEVEAAIERLICDVAFRHQLGNEAKRFVTSRWCPAAVAERYMQLLTDVVPESWWRDPSECMYTYGCGVDSETVAVNVAMLVRYHGLNALQVNDKPALTALLRDMARPKSHAA